MKIRFSHQELQRSGWTVGKVISGPISTAAIAQTIGWAIEEKKDSPLVTELVPKPKDLARTNTTSAIYGLGAFPPHTDMAHWPLTPRFILLRPKVAVENVPTYLLDSRLATSRIEVKRILKRAVWKICRVRRPFLCSAYFQSEGEFGLRWDPCTMLPYGQVATETRELIAGTFDDIFRQSRIAIDWKDCNDFLVIDNWRILHSRPEVPATAQHRVLERVLLIRIFQSA